jgi:hypothetical protein
MRYYVGTCEMKWSHVGRIEQIWIRRELGDELFEEIQQEWHTVVILRTNSQTLPGDTYKRCDVYTDIADTPRATVFALRFSDKIRKAELA